MKTDNNLFKKVLSQKIELGRQVQIDYPDIVKEYINIENGLDGLAKKLDIMNKYNLLSEEIAKGVVFMALHGYDGKYSFINTPSYKKLISEKELLEISLQKIFYRNS